MAGLRSDQLTPPRQAADVHALVQLQATIGACGLVAQNTHPVLVAGPRHQQTVDELLRGHAVDAHRYALFMPGCQAAVRLKRWGWRRFAALAMAMREQGVERIVIVGTHEEYDECEAIAAACPSFVVRPVSSILYSLRMALRVWFRMTPVRPMWRRSLRDRW